MNDPKPRASPGLVALVAAAAALSLAAVTAAAQPAKAKPPQQGKKPAPAAAAKTAPEKKAAVRITEDTDDPAIWGQEYPAEYETYKKTVDQVRTKYGGSEALPHAPEKRRTRARSSSQSKIQDDPRLKTMWAGYAFSVDFREERGHAYMLEDQTFTKRQVVVKQPGACMQCHASVVVPYRKLGNGDPMEGFREDELDAVRRGAQASSRTRSPASTATTRRR